MKKQPYKVFPNKVLMFNFFKQYIPELNVSASARFPLFGFALGNKMHNHKSCPDMFAELKELSGLPVDAKHSVNRMGSYIVFFTEDFENKPDSTKAKIVNKKEVQPKVQGVEQEVKEDPKPALDVSDVLAKAESFRSEDEKQAKEDLAKFAEGHGVNLSKRKSFDNMLSDLKEISK